MEKNKHASLQIGDWLALANRCLNLEIEIWSMWMLHLLLIPCSFQKELIRFGIFQIILLISRILHQLTCQKFPSSIYSVFPASGTGCTGLFPSFKPPRPSVTSPRSVQQVERQSSQPSLKAAVLVAGLRNGDDLGPGMVEIQSYC